MGGGGVGVLPASVFFLYKGFTIIFSVRTKCKIRFIQIKVNCKRKNMVIAKVLNLVFFLTTFPMGHLAYVAPSAEKAAKIPCLQNCEPCIRIRRFPTCL